MPKAIYEINMQTMERLGRRGLGRVGGRSLRRRPGGFARDSVAGDGATR